MAFHIRDRETDALVRELARRRGKGLTDAVKTAVRNELHLAEKVVPLRERLRKIAEPLARRKDTGRAIDKAFFDDLSGS